MINTFKLLKQRFLNQFNNICFTSINSVNLVGRSYLTPADLTGEEIKSILWTAIELKCLLAQKEFNPNYLKNRKITLLLTNPCLITQGSAMSAANMMKSHLNVIIDSTWDTKCVKSVGKIISSYSDLIFCKSQYESKLKFIIEASNVPVVCVRSCSFSILDGLADLMAIQEKHGYLSGLNLGWIGEATPLINTYMCTALKVGINIKYHCACGKDSGLSPSMLPAGRQITTVEPAVLTECELASKALEKVDIIVLADYDIIKYQNIKIEDLDSKANKDWSLFTYIPLPKSGNENFCNHPNSLVWRSKINLQWIYAAIMLRCLNSHKHCTQMPNFDKIAKL